MKTPPNEYTNDARPRLGEGWKRPPTCETACSTEKTGSMPHVRLASMNPSRPVATENCPFSTPRRMSWATCVWKGAERSREVSADQRAARGRLVIKMTHHSVQAVNSQAERVKERGGMTLHVSGGTPRRPHRWPPSRRACSHSPPYHTHKQPPRINSRLS